MDRRSFFAAGAVGIASVASAASATKVPAFPTPKSPEPRPLTEEIVREIAEEEIPQLTSISDYTITVMRAPRQHCVFLVFWDVFQTDNIGRYLSRATGVNATESPDVLRKRLRAVFDEPPRLVGLFEADEIYITDC